MSASEQQHSEAGAGGGDDLAGSRERHARLKELFLGALALTPGERPGYLERSSGGDASLRAEAEELLASAGPAAAAFGSRPLREILLASEAPPGRTEEPGPLPASVGPYRVEGVLGRGGMGVVYLARDPRLDRTVALKSLPASVAADPAARARLEGEARALARLNHPNVAAIHGLEEAEGRLYLVMEHVAGETLAERTARGPLAPAEAVRVAVQVAAGLEEAHEHGVIHRDLKPGNVMCGAQGRVKVLDFGLARPAGSIGEGRLLGTPGYMSPEQLAGAAAEVRADVWSFGCLLYECLSGVAAFAGPTPHARLTAPLERDPDWTRLPEATPAGLRKLVERCLARAPEERPEHMGEVRRQLERELPTWAALDRPRHSLPAEPDAFVGRTSELAEVSARLDGGARLLTLLGTAGSGKTRLARRFGWTTLERWPGGAWFADLSEARSVDGIVSAVGSALGVPLAGGDPVVQLGHAIAGRGRCLMILDNFEQVAERAPETLGRWLARAGQAAFLVTSRQRLKLAGEHVLEVEGVPIETDGLELFRLRARAQRSGFAADGKDAETVIEIVRLLDSLPLAIELAAARVRVLSPEQILERLTDRFKLLVDGEGRVSRQQTLERAIAWSWDQLNGWEQGALAQMSVFAGGFTLEAAEAVVDLGAWPEAPPTVDVVQALVDRSLLRATEAEGAPRFSMLVSVAEYAARKLGHLGGEEVRAAEERHGKWFARFGSEESLELLARHGGVTRRRRLALDLDNLVSACPRAVGRADGATAASALAAAWEVLELRGQYRVALELARSVADTASLTSGERLVVLRTLGEAALFARRVEEARSTSEAALAIARALGQRHSESLILCRLGLLDAMSGRTEARERLEQALALGRAVGSRSAEGTALGALGWLEFKLGSLPEARQRLEQSFAVWRELGHRRLEGIVVGNLGSCHCHGGWLDAGRGRFEEAIAILRKVGDIVHECSYLTSLGMVHQEQGRLSEARAAWEEALALGRAVGSRKAEGVVLGCVANLHAQQARMEEARASLELTRAIARELDKHNGRALLLLLLGEGHARLGEKGAAQVQLDEGLRIARELGDHRNEAIALVRLAALHLESGAFGDAREAAACGEAILRSAGDRVELAKLLRVRADLERAEGDPGRARATLAEAEALAALIGAGPASEIGQNLARLRETLGPS